MSEVSELRSERSSCRAKFYRPVHTSRRTLSRAQSVLYKMYRIAGFDFSKFRYNLMQNVLIPLLHPTESLLHTSNHSDPALYTVPNKVPAPNKHTVTSDRRPMAPRASSLLDLQLPDQCIDCPIIWGPRWKQR